MKRHPEPIGIQAAEQPAELIELAIRKTHRTGTTRTSHSFRCNVGGGLDHRFGDGGRGRTMFEPDTRS